MNSLKLLFSSRWRDTESTSTSAPKQDYPEPTAEVETEKAPAPASIPTLMDRYSPYPSRTPSAGQYNRNSRHNAINPRQQTNNFQRDHANLLARLGSVSRERDNFRREAEQYEDDNMALKSLNKDLRRIGRQHRQTISDLVHSKENLKKTLESKDQEVLSSQYDADRYRFIISKYIKPYASSKNIEYNDGTPNSVQSFFNILVGDLEENDALRAQCSSLQHQVQSLQQELLYNIEKVEYATDAQLASDFRALRMTIKSFCRSIKPLNNDEVISLDIVQQSLFVTKVPPRYWLGRGRTKHLLEAFVWSTLYEQLFNGPFLLFGQYHMGLSAEYCQIFSEENVIWPLPSHQAELFRYTTIEQILKKVDLDVLTQGKENDHPTYLNQSIMQTRMQLRGDIVAPFSNISPGTDFSKVNGILDKAFALSLKMGLQRCRVQIVHPEIGDAYTLGQPDLSSIPESEDLESGTVAFIINPGIAKWGNAEGKMLDQRMDIVPSLVFVEQTPTMVKQEPTIKMEPSSTPAPEIKMEDMDHDVVYDADDKDLHLVSH